jgi:hypothetical protein
VIEDAIFTRLSTDSSGVGSIVAEASSPIRYRIYRMVIPQFSEGDLTKFPCVVYSKVGAGRTLNFGGTNDVVRGDFQLDHYATTYESATALADAARVRLTDFVGSLVGEEIKATELQNEFVLDDPEPGVFRVSQSWIIWYVD